MRLDRFITAGLVLTNVLPVVPQKSSTQASVSFDGSIEKDLMKKRQVCQLGCDEEHGAKCRWVFRNDGDDSDRVDSDRVDKDAGISKVNTWLRWTIGDTAPIIGVVEPGNLKGLEQGLLCCAAQPINDQILDIDQFNNALTNEDFRSIFMHFKSLGENSIGNDLKDSNGNKLSQEARDVSILLFSISKVLTLFQNPKLFKEYFTDERKIMIDYISGGNELIKDYLNSIDNEVGFLGVFMPYMEEHLVETGKDVCSGNEEYFQYFKPLDNVDGIKSFYNRSDIYEQLLEWVQ